MIVDDKCLKRQWYVGNVEQLEEHWAIIDLDQALCQEGEEGGLLQQKVSIWVDSLVGAGQCPEEDVVVENHAFLAASIDKPIISVQAKATLILHF